MYPIMVSLEEGQVVGSFGGVLMVVLTRWDEGIHVSYHG